MQERKVSIKKLSIIAVLLILILALITSFTLSAFSAKATMTGWIQFQDNIAVLAKATASGATNNNSGSVSYQMNIADSESASHIICGDKEGNFKQMTYGSGKAVAPGLVYEITADLPVYIGFELDIRFVPNDASSLNFASTDDFNIFPSFKNLDYEKILYGQNGDKSDYSFTYPKSKVSNYITKGASFFSDCDLQITAPYLNNGVQKGYNGKSYFAKTYRMYFTRTVDGYSDYAKINFANSQINKVEINFDNIIGDMRFATLFVDENGDTYSSNLIQNTAGKLYITFSCRVDKDQFYDGFINSSSGAY